MYNCYQLIQHLFTISDTKFTDEFEINNEESLNMLVNFVKEDEVTTLSELRMKASIVKYVEYSLIYFDFSDDFKIEDISDDAVASMLDNIENRL